MQKNQRETRSYREAELRLDSASSGNTLNGYIAVFNSNSESMGGFTEVLAPGCFTRSLRQAAEADIVALINHDSDAPVGRLSAGTLRLKEDERGLAFSVDLPDTTRAKDLRISIERRDVKGCSFGFFCMDDKWESLSDGTIRRTIRDMDLFEVSVGVTFPAYPESSMTLRNLPDSMPPEIRSLLEKQDPPAIPDEFRSDEAPAPAAESDPAHAHYIAMQLALLERKK